MLLAKYLFPLSIVWYLLAAAAFVIGCVLACSSSAGARGAGWTLMIVSYVVFFGPAAYRVFVAPNDALFRSADGPAEFAY